MGGRAPAGYERFTVGSSRVVAKREYRDGIRAALDSGTLLDWAAAHPRARALQGRGIAYAVPLPESQHRVVVRRNRHGGALGGLRGDVFLPPTRAARELAASLRLTAAGVPTPEIVAYAIYPAGAVALRSDVATGEIPGSRDLGHVLVEDSPAERRRALDATARLVAALTAAGARHPDLNVKNVLIRARRGKTAQAYALDVDRVVFDRKGSQRVLAANLARLERSARKWRKLHGARIPDADLAYLATRARQELGRLLDSK